MALRGVSRWPRFVVTLLCFAGVSSYVPGTPSVPLRDVLQEVVTEAVRKHCPGKTGVPPEQADPAWRCSCPTGFIPCAGRCYALLHRAVDYAQAEKDCAAVGAHLAVPRSREQNLCAAGLAGRRGVWLGITDRQREGLFQGADGRPVTASEGQVWSAGQPDNTGGHEDCVEFRANFPFATWNDWVCGGPGVVNLPMCQLSVV